VSLVLAMSDEAQQRPPLRLLPGGRSREQRDEDALVGAWLVGDDEAFGELVRRHEPLVLALVRRWARTPEDARDLAQRTFLRAFESARRHLVRGEPSAVPFRRWLVRVAINLAKNHVRDETRWTRSPVTETLADGSTPALEALEREQRRVRVRRAVASLPRRQREVLTLRLDVELPFAEIAAALLITENAAKVAFHHATRRLRELLDAQGPEVPSP
jgi:RNA polymerase sigma-70 factor, ECF subfamily